jgi:hypothetical protein
MLIKLILLACLLSMTACSSARKARQAEREKAINSTGFVCDFVNGDAYADIEVQLNLEMAKRCDSNKNFSMSYFKNSADVTGIVYCCSLTKGRNTEKATEKSFEKTSNKDFDEKIFEQPKKTPIQPKSEPKPAPSTQAPAKAPASADEELDK